jgi:hypothetical protein
MAFGKDGFVRDFTLETTPWVAELTEALSF